MTKRSNIYIWILFVWTFRLRETNHLFNLDVNPSQLYKFVYLHFVLLQEEQEKT